MDQALKDKCLIVSIYMDNIHPTTVEKHRAVVQKYSNGFRSVYAKTKLDHPGTMDTLWNSEITKEVDALLFLDIDAIPLRSKALEDLFGLALGGNLVGNVQRSNHLDNNQHMFVAPSAMAISVATYNKIGRPSARPTNRSDVAEEYTWAAEHHGVNIGMLWPISYDRPVNRMAWETDKSPTWKLADGYPEYGVGTTFGYRDPLDNSSSAPKLPLFWHSFQSFHPGHQEMFWAKCDEVLKD